VEGQVAYGTKPVEEKVTKKERIPGEGRGAAEDAGRWIWKVEREEEFWREEGGGRRRTSWGL
jgi:hypothetical protein